MARRNPDHPPEIGKRWPYKALNYLPMGPVWKFLTWKSGGDAAPPAFDPGQALSQPLRILIRVPEDPQNLLIAFPAIQCLVQALSGSEFLLLVPERWAGFLGGLYGPERILSLRPEGFLWGEAHFQESVRSAAAFRPELTLNLAEETHPLMHFLLRSSGAAIRVQLRGDAPAAFVNLWLRPSEPPNQLRGYLQTLKLWNFSAHPIPARWSRLAADPENLKEAAVRLQAKGLKPKTTRLFLWQGVAPQREGELYQAAIRKRSPQGTAQALAVVYGAGALWGSPPPPADLVFASPVLEVESTGLLLGLFTLTACSIGTNGPLVQLAGLADTEVEAHFGEADDPWDTGFLNPRFKVIRAAPKADAEGKPEAGPAG